MSERGGQNFDLRSVIPNDHHHRRHQNVTASPTRNLLRLTLTLILKEMTLVCCISAGWQRLLKMLNARQALSYWIELLFPPHYRPDFAVLSVCVLLSCHQSTTPIPVNLPPLIQVWGKNSFYYQTGLLSVLTVWVVAVHVPFLTFVHPVAIVDDADLAKPTVGPCFDNRVAHTP